MFQPIGSFFVLMGMCTALLCGYGAEASDKIQATHGVMSAEVTDSSVIIWSRTDQPAQMHVKLRPRHGTRTRVVEVTAASDYSGQIEFTGLRADTRYRYSVWFTPLKDSQSGASRGEMAQGRFSTAPVDNAHKPVKIVWSGDFAGQNVCRDVADGFPIFNAIDAESADMFIGLGDMIYADNTCESTGRYGNRQVAGHFAQATDLPSFWAHWRYNREDPGFLTLLQSTPYFGVWDDHEVVNDFGPQTDMRSDAPYTQGEALLPIGLKAFLDYTPMPKRDATPHRLYRNVRWGRHAELFFLDNRQYRDANRVADSGAIEKTMLGREQLTWLVDKLEASKATWKIIVSSVPVSIPTGFPSEGGRDGWANFDESSGLTIDGIPQSHTGFERELGVILSTLQRTASNVLFITTDVHFAEVFRYSLESEDDTFTFHEVVIGPGNAGIFPNRNFDKSLGTESLFFYGPESADAVTSWEEAKKWFNYGVITIGRSGDLSAQVKKTNGETVYTIKLAP